MWSVCTYCIARRCVYVLIVLHSIIVTLHCMCCVVLHCTHACLHVRMYVCFGGWLSVVWEWFEEPLSCSANGRVSSLNKVGSLRTITVGIVVAFVALVVHFVFILVLPFAAEFCSIHNWLRSSETRAPEGERAGLPVMQRCSLCNWTIMDLPLYSISHC